MSEKKQNTNTKRNSEGVKKIFSAPAKSTPSPKNNKDGKGRSGSGNGIGASKK